MSRTAKPALGYPSRTAAALALKAEGLRVGQIAERLGISPNAVSGLLSMVRRRTEDMPRPVDPGIREITLNPVILRALRPHALRRDLQSQTLAIMIIEAVVEHRLVDAVLDDRDSRGADRVKGETHV